MVDGIEIVGSEDNVKMNFTSIRQSEMWVTFDKKDLAKLAKELNEWLGLMQELSCPFRVIPDK